METFEMIVVGCAVFSSIVYVIWNLVSQFFRKPPSNTIKNTLNYRYQLVFKEGIALSPRLSLVLPSGNNKKGLGNGSTGFQINLPLSIRLSDS